jgi:hypothetical protein
MCSVVGDILAVIVRLSFVYRSFVGRTLQCILQKPSTEMRSARCIVDGSGLHRSSVPVRIEVFHSAGEVFHSAGEVFHSAGEVFGA